MARFDHVVRVARALQKLQETRAGITVRALAQELEVGERTAYRYIEALIRRGTRWRTKVGGFACREQPRLD